MNREEKRQLVCQLYKDGKTMREIAKEVHMSFSHIGSITKNLNDESESKTKEKSKESQALELFKKGKNPVDVSITIDLNPSEVVQIYGQFWELRGLYNLLDLYKMVKADTSLLMRVHDVVKKYDLSKKDIINIVYYADKYCFLKEEVDDLEMQFDHLMKQRHIANDSLLYTKKKQMELAGQIETYNDIIKQKLACIENVDIEIKKLENQISLLKNDDKYYAKFEQNAREKLGVILKERRWILASAISAVIESMRKEPFKELIINDQIIDEMNQQKLLELCEKLFDIILKQLIDESMEIKITPEINSDIHTLVPTLSESEST
jgi:hypothetical protein